MKRNKPGSTMRSNNGVRRCNYHQHLFLWAIAGSFLLGMQAVYAQAPSTEPKKLDAADLAGDWKLVYDSEAPNCVTISFKIDLEASGQIRGEEIRRCTDTVRLNYDVRLFRQGGRSLLALNPPPENSGIKAVEPIDETTKSTGYRPDQLTLWVSVDGCALTGWRKDRTLVGYGVKFEKARCY